MGILASQTAHKTTRVIFLLTFQIKYTNHKEVYSEEKLQQCLKCFKYQSYKYYHSFFIKWADQGMLSVQRWQPQ